MLEVLPRAITPHETADLLACSSASARTSESPNSIPAKALVRGLQHARDERIAAFVARNNPEFIEAMRDGVFGSFNLGALAEKADRAAVWRLRESRTHTRNGRLRHSSMQEEVLNTQSFDVWCYATPHRILRDPHSFQGEPTPLLYTTRVTEALLATGHFPSLTLPKLTISYSPYYYHPEALRLRERMGNCARVFAFSSMAEGHGFERRMIRGIHNWVSPEAIIIQGGSFHDGTNPYAVARAIQKDRTSIVLQTEQGKLNAAHNAYFGKPDERHPGRIVVCGDGEFIFAKLLEIIGDDPHATSENIHKLLDFRSRELQACPGVGDVFWWNPDRNELQHVALSGQPLDLNQLPFISRNSTENRYAIFDRQPTAQLMFRWGCRESCTFCGEGDRGKSYDVRKISARTAQNMLLEIERIIENDNIKHFFFDDSYFLMGVNDLKELIDGLKILKKKHPELQFGCQTTIDSILQHIDELGDLRDAGFTYFYVGLEGADPAASTEAVVTKALKHSALPDQRDASWLQRFRRMAEALRQYPEFRLGASLLFGLGESLDDCRAVLETVQEYREAGLIADDSVALNVRAVYPETGVYREALQRKDGSHFDFRDIQFPPTSGFETFIEGHSLSVEDAIKRRDLAYAICGKAVHGFPNPDVAPWGLKYMRSTVGLQVWDPADGAHCIIDDEMRGSEVKEALEAEARELGFEGVLWEEGMPGSAQAYV